MPKFFGALFHGAQNLGKGKGAEGVKALPKDLDHFYWFYIVEFHHTSFEFWQNVQRGGWVWACQNIGALFFFTFYHFRLFKSAGRKNSVQKPTTFSEANKMKFHAVLSHFAKCFNLHVKSAPRLPKIEGGLPIWAMPVFSPFF